MPPATGTRSYAGTQQRFCSDAAPRKPPSTPCNDALPNAACTATDHCAGGTPTFTARVTTLRGHIPSLHHPAPETLQIRLTGLTPAALAATGLWVVVFHAITG